MTTEADRQQLADLGRRIQALSTLQEQFYRSPDFRQVDFTSFLHELAGNLVGMASERVSLDRQLALMTLPVDVAVPPGLVANEVITNALKHAFPEGRAGRLLIHLERDGARLT